MEHLRHDEGLQRIQHRPNRTTGAAGAARAGADGRHESRRPDGAALFGACGHRPPGLRFDGRRVRRNSRQQPAVGGGRWRSDHPVAAALAAGALGRAHRPVAPRGAARPHQGLHRSKSARPGLSIDQIADALHCGKRNLHKVFSHDGTTISDFIWRLRLERCRDDLAAPTCAWKSITEIAFSWGFNSSTHFSKAFKEALRHATARLPAGGGQESEHLRPRFGATRHSRRRWRRSCSSIDLPTNRAG